MNEQEGRFISFAGGLPAADALPGELVSKVCKSW